VLTVAANPAAVNGSARKVSGTRCLEGSLQIQLAEVARTTGLRSFRQDSGLASSPMLLLNPFCPVPAAKILALKATVLLLLTLLIKAKLQIKVASSVGWLLLLLQTILFLAVAGALGVAALGGATAYGLHRREV
jgi:hypothetical protein